VRLPMPVSANASSCLSSAIRSVIMALQPLIGPWPLSQFLNPAISR
jgi:hypothetical protein